MSKRLLAWLLLAAWGIGIYAFTAGSGARQDGEVTVFAYPGYRMPTIPGGWERLVVRKAGHVAVFATGAVLALAAFGRRRISMAWAVVAGFGALDEWHQAFIVGRTSALPDVLLNAGAALLAVAVLHGWGRSRRKVRTHESPGITMLRW